MTTRIRIVAGFASLCLPLLSLAQNAPSGPPAGAPPGPPPGGMPAGMGGDKSLDQRPFFDAVDANHDGIVTLKEWLAAGLPENVFRMIAKQGSDTASWEDFQNHPPMKSFDTNGDGKISLDEIKVAIAQMKSGGPNGPPGAPPAGAAPPPADH